jgi:hypothetical protein
MRRLADHRGRSPAAHSAAARAQGRPLPSLSRASRSVAVEVLVQFSPALPQPFTILAYRSPPEHLTPDPTGQLDYRLGVGLQIQPPGWLSRTPAVHGHRDQVGPRASRDSLLAVGATGAPVHGSLRAHSATGSDGYGQTGDRSTRRRGDIRSHEPFRRGAPPHPRRARATAALRRAFLAVSSPTSWEDENGIRFADL